MNGPPDKRVAFRRYSDRRNVLMLALYEILFEQDPGQERDRLLLEAIRESYGADRLVWVAPCRGDSPCLAVRTTAPEWSLHKPGDTLGGSGVAALLDVQALCPVSLSLTRVSRPSAFELEAWENFWAVGLKGAASSLLSIGIAPQVAAPSLLWVLQTRYSREWNIRDRDLAEEVACLLAKSADKDVAGERSE